MPRKVERTALFFLLAASPICLPAVPIRFTQSVRSFVADSLHLPFQAVHAGQVGLEHLTSGFVEWMSLHEENRILRAQLEALQAHEETHRQLYQENARLRKLLEFRDRIPWSAVSSEVIARELGPWSQTLLIDKGQREGIRAGMAVVTPTGLVGRISEVSNSSSRVVLLTDPHFRVSATLLSSRTWGLVMGASGGESSLTYLSLDLKIPDGESVLTAGGRSFCPDGIPIGTTRKVWIDGSQLFQTARLQPAVNPGTVEEVLVLAWRSSERSASF